MNGESVDIKILKSWNCSGPKNTKISRIFWTPQLGLIDANETPIDTAKRELKEETGYTLSRVISCASGKQFLDPGLGDHSVRFVTVEVEGDDEVNRDPTPIQNDNEYLEIITVECDKLLEYLEGVLERGEAQVKASLYSFALCYDLKNKMAI